MARSPGLVGHRRRGNRAGGRWRWWRRTRRDRRRGGDQTLHRLRRNSVCSLSPNKIRGLKPAGRGQLPELLRRNRAQVATVARVVPFVGHAELLRTGRSTRLKRRIMDSWIEGTSGREDPCAILLGRSVAVAFKRPSLASLQHSLAARSRDNRRAQLERQSRPVCE